MVKAKNLPTFAYLKPSVYYYLKQMLSKYITRASFVIMTALILSSCLGNNQADDLTDTYKDAQIYSFSLSSRADSTRAFSDSPFTIDQIGGCIFNKKPLPYLFNVDSVKMNITGFTSYGKSFSQVVIVLQNNDSSYIWNLSDSIAVNRLKQITTTAADGKTTKTYDFELNVYQEDPNVLSWEKLQSNYISASSVEAQRTVSFKEKFITYYISGSEVKSMTSADGVDWVAASVIGLPATVKLSSVIVGENAVYALDKTNKLYKTTDGLNWGASVTAYPIVAIYGKLPSATKGTILTIVDNGGVNTFAETSDFSSFHLMNVVPEGIPVWDFSATQIENPKVYSAKYILLSGGVSIDNKPNTNTVWLLQEKNEAIAFITQTMSFDLQGSTVFNYNNNQYMIATNNGKNTLLLSEGYYGMTWKTGGTNQEFPEDFAYRTNASVVTDKNNYIWIFGGKSGASTQVVDVWRGKLNILMDN